MFFFIIDNKKANQPQILKNKVVNLIRRIKCLWLNCELLFRNSNCWSTKITQEKTNQSLF